MIALVPPRQQVVIHSEQVIRQGLDRFFGIDLNYIRDRDANRASGARTLDGALRDLGAKWLRFPGGEKSDFHLWSQPPYEKPNPISLGWYATVKGSRMDFDEFIRHARAVGAEPYVVVGCDSFARTGRTEAQWLETAVAWVRYSNLVKHFGVKFWEIGNENWNNHTATPEEMARIVVEFSKAMKRVDPGIRIGASGQGDDWWSKFLPQAASALDFLTVSQYTGWEWKNFSRFLQNPPLIDSARHAIEAIDRYAPPADRGRLRVIVAEANAKDYAPNGWPDSNDIGHALVTFGTLAELARQPRIEAAMVWTTRWMNDAEASSSQFYALDAQNRLTPTGQALAILGHFALPVLLDADSPDVLAARSQDARKMTVWLLNRESDSRESQIRIEGATYRSALEYRFDGSAQIDRIPKWRKIGELRVKGNQIEERLSPLSITVLSLSS